MYEKVKIAIDVTLGRISTGRERERETKSNSKRYFPENCHMHFPTIYEQPPVCSTFFIHNLNNLAVGKLLHDVKVFNQCVPYTVPSTSINERSVIKTEFLPFR